MPCGISAAASGEIGSEACGASGGQEKLFSILHSSYRWSDSLEVPNVGALNKMIADGKGQDLILMQEALQEKNIGQVAEQAVKDPDRRIVMIAGPSSSGKQHSATGFRRSLQRSDIIRIRSLWTIISATGKSIRSMRTDSRILRRSGVDIPQFNEDMNALLSGKTIELPRFNFKTGKREYKGEMLKLERRIFSSSRASTA